VIDPVVRRGEAADADVLAALEHEARSAVGLGRGGSRWLQTHPALAEGWPEAIDGGGVFVATIATDGHAAVVGASDRAVIVGYLVASVHADAERVVTVDQVYVHPDARELGFGDALLEAAMRFGRSQGAALIEAETLPGDREIKNLYERAGVTARLIVVSRRLDG